MIRENLHESDFLLETLTALASEFEVYKIPLIVGGGFSLYIKTRFLKKTRSPRYPIQPFIRSTKDIDVFLTSDIIIDLEKVKNIKTVLAKLNFEVKTEYFQYQKKIKFADESRDVILDFLSQPVSLQDLNKVKIRKPRIKPVGAEEFHAFYHEEAAVINSRMISVGELVEVELVTKFRNVFLPSSLSFIILKLHAFRDRLNDREKEYGRHHAYDIFSAIIEMDENDWKNSKLQLEELHDSSVIIESKRIVSEYFISETHMGIIRLKENQYYKRDQKEFDSYLEQFLVDLKDLFNF